MWFDCKLDMDKCQIKIWKKYQWIFWKFKFKICIMIGLELNKSNVHAIHITKNAYIKLHVDKRDNGLFHYRLVNKRFTKWRLFSSASIMVPIFN